MKSLLSSWVLFSCLGGAASFSGVQLHPRAPCLTALQASTRKGFGSTPESPKSKKKAAPSTEPVAVTTTASSSGGVETSKPAAAATTQSSEEEPQPVNAGQRALAEMRRQRAEQKDAELRKVREMLQADQQVKERQGAAIPERVAQRMGQRMLPFVGIPLVGGMSCFVAFWYLATYRDMEFQPALVAFSTILILVFSLLVRSVQRVCV